MSHRCTVASCSRSSRNATLGVMRRIICPNASWSDAASGVELVKPEPLAELMRFLPDRWRLRLSGDLRPPHGRNDNQPRPPCFSILRVHFTLSSTCCRYDLTFLSFSHLRPMADTMPGIAARGNCGSY